MLSSELNSKGVVKKENGAEDVYYRVKINPIQFSEKESNLNDLKQAINLLESFRQGKIKTSDAFDADHLAKVMALRALLGSYQFDWLDTKFYYNPRTKLLEPISKEIHVDLNLITKFIILHGGLIVTSIDLTMRKIKIFLLMICIKIKNFMKSI